MEQLYAAMVLSGIGAVIGARMLEAWRQRHDCPECDRGHTAASVCPECFWPEASSEMIEHDGHLVATVLHCRRCHGASIVTYE